jgi:hypothetical protein
MGERGVYTLVLCSLATVMSSIDPSGQDSDKIPEGRVSTYILHLSVFMEQGRVKKLKETTVSAVVERVSTLHTSDCQNR